MHTKKTASYESIVRSDCKKRNMTDSILEKYYIFPFLLALLCRGK